MTHDSIGLGEDGPTHQPVEHLAALRAMPNMRVLRPADAIETLECWQMALERVAGPTVLALSRQNLPPLRSASADNRSAAGAYELLAADGTAQVSIFASGSEVSVAVEARKLLAERGIKARVVSVPSLDAFLETSDSVRAGVIGSAPVKVAIEAAVRFGWDAVIGHDGIFIGMHGFGSSAPAKDLYKHFGITAEAAAEAAAARLKTR
jgi:transketolase